MKLLLKLREPLLQCLFIRSFDKKDTIAIVGLGYVGLPLAVEFGKKMQTLGLDLSVEKVAAFRRHTDLTGEVSEKELREATQLQFYTDPAVIKHADFVIVAVPTPVDSAHKPDLTPLIKSSETVGKYVKHGAIIVYEINSISWCD